MRRLGSLLLSAAFAAAVGAVCFAVGGRQGFVHGYVLAAHTGEVLTGNIAILSMDAASEGDEATARALLEHFVDTALISAWSHERIGPERRFYVPEEYYLDLDRPVGRLAQHRKSHPHSLGSEHADSMLDEIVARHTGSGAER